MLQISWSSLQEWESCHQRWFRVLQKKKSLTQDVRIFFPGTVTDRVMRKWLELDDPQRGQMVQMVDEIFDYQETAEGVVRWRSVNDRAVTMNMVREAVQNLEPILMKYVLPYDYHPELKFRIEAKIPYLDGKPTKIVLAGGIDIAVRLPNRDYYLYDLKTTRNQSYVNKTLGQAIFYDLAFGHYVGEPGQPKQFGFIMPLCPQQMVMTNITHADRSALMTRIISMAHGVWQKDYEPKKTASGCNICPVQHACDKYNPAVEPSGKKKRVEL